MHQFYFVITEDSLWLFFTTMFYSLSSWYNTYTTKTSFRWETFATKSFLRISGIFLAYKWKLIYSMWNEITKFSWDWKKNVVLCKCWFTVYIGMIRSTYTYYKVLQQSKEWYLYPLTCSSAWLSYWKPSLSKGLLQLRKKC